MKSHICLSCRAITILLCAAILLILPVAPCLNANAETIVSDWSALKATMNTNGYIILDSDIYAPFPENSESFLSVAKNTLVTIDLNGHTLSRNLNKEVLNGYTIKNSGNLTILDSSVDKSGVICGGYNKGAGGAIYNYSGTLTLRNFAFCGNTASSGGAIYNYSGTISLNNCIFRDNIASSGGAIYSLSKSTVKLQNCLIENNTAEYGAGIYNATGCNTEILSGQISQNSATSAGGGIYNNGNVTISGGSIIQNGATKSGGGIYSTGILNISGGYINENIVAEGSGGGVYSTGLNSELRLTGGCISGNSAIFGNGSGVYVSGGTIDVSGPVFVLENNKTNFALGYDKQISITGALTSGAQIGIGTVSAGYPIAIAAGSGYTLTPSDYDKFSSDSDSCVVQWQDNSIVLTKHEQSSPKRLTSDDLIFTPPANTVYDNTPKFATIQPKEGISGVGKITVKYICISVEDGVCSTVPPTDIGVYLVCIDIEKGDVYPARSDMISTKWLFEITENSDILYGDCNSDGYINAKDILLLRRYLGGHNVVVDLSAADTMYDHAVNAKDLLILSKYLADYPVVLGPGKLQ